MANAFVVINSGSTSVKFAAYTGDDPESLDLVCRGQLDGIGSQPSFTAKNAKGELVDTQTWDKGRVLGREDALKFVITWLERHEAGLRVVAVGHRVLQGGVAHDRPVVVDGKVLAELETLVPIVPLHQPFELEAIRALARTYPKLRQVAVFDTSFHRTMPEVAQRYALPAAVLGNEIRHWGYHGISYDYISRALPRYAPKARRVIAAHLGGGASMCAMRDGKSVDTSMGFSASDGLPMATRCGGIDPYIPVFLLNSKKCSPAELETVLNHKSGLLGLSGISGDMRVLKASQAPAAAAAIDHLVYQIVKFAGAYAAVLGGVDALVFTAGIGENDAQLRAKVLGKLGWLGAKLDPDAN
ncbi:MAG TPA: acetate/propionate family kinase, partial [Bradyrhizobium sp.]|nr:acetate/propionate family kinase [Bradyrhizobium sp.]